MFENIFNYGVISRGIEDGLMKINPINLRDYTHDKHHMTDDYPYGGGQGLVMKPEPLIEAISAIKERENTLTILLDPRGVTFNQNVAIDLVHRLNCKTVFAKSSDTSECMLERGVDFHNAGGTCAKNGTKENQAGNFGNSADDIVKSENRINDTSEENSNLKKNERDALCKLGTGYDSVTLICGRYEGYDERIRNLYEVNGVQASLIDLELSLGDFIISGGELASMVVIDALGRLIDGVLGDSMSSVEDSFTAGLLEHPQYTRPSEHLGYSVPVELLSGNHSTIEEWRHSKSWEITKRTRPDLVRRYYLDNSKHNSDLKLYLGLFHYPMRDKQKDVVATSVTNMDIHDISRSCKTFGVRKYFIVTPLKAQQEIVGRVINHWMHGYGSTYNSNRKEAFNDTIISDGLLDTMQQIEQIEGVRPKLAITTARTDKEPVDASFIRYASTKEPILLMFGTGWGFEAGVYDIVDYVVKPIYGAFEYNHLSVRSAVAIMLDRIINCEIF